MRDGLRVAAVIAVIAVLAFAWQQPPEGAYDAYAFYNARLPDPYAVSTEGQPGALLYSPAFVQLLTPFQQLPWPLFRVLWAGVSLVALWYLVGPVLLVPTLVLWPFTLIELGFGNINLWLAAAVVLGMRRAVAWDLVLLTKVTPGVGLAWFAVRREWRLLAVALGTTVALAGVSFTLDPSLWFQWFELLRANSTVAAGDLAIPLWVRLSAALIVVTWGARTGRSWTVALAAAVALPFISMVNASIFVGVVGILRRTRWRFGPTSWPAGGTGR